MKKSILGLLTVAGIITSSLALADEVNKNAGYYSTQHPATATTSLKSATLFPPTDISVTNASNSVVFVIVPNTPINDTLYPNSQPDHIRNNNGAYWTNIVLQDPNRNTFFNNTVCPRALVTVFGGPGSYKVNVDNEYCN